MNIANNLENAAFHFPDRCAVVDSSRQITYGQFNSETSSIAAALAAVDVGPGDHVALCAPNSYAWLAFYFGVLKAGTVAVTFSRMLTGAEKPDAGDVRIGEVPNFPSYFPTAGRKYCLRLTRNWMRSVI